MPKERKPDLASDNYSDIEKRVDDLMSGRSTKAKNKPTDDGYLPSAPDIPMDDKRLDVRVIRDGEQPQKAPAQKATQTSGAIKSPASEGDAPTTTSETSKSAAASLLDEPSTDEAVKDIINHESDELLAVSDSAQQVPDDTEQKQGLFRRFGAGFVAWWKHPVKRRVSLLVIGLVIVVAGAVPTSRYAILNAFGVRSSTSLTVIDNSSNQPLRNVHVSIGDASASTNEDGYVSLHDVKLGRHDIKIERRAFAERTIDVTLGWGSNPLGEHWLQPTGAQYVFIVDDYVSGEPLSKAEITYEDVSAYTDEDGLARLTVDIDNEVSELDVEIVAEGYRTEALELDANTEDDQPVQLVPALKHFFVSERQGRFDVYAVDVDGENEEAILEATGAERDDITLLPHPTKNRVAVISTRDNVRNNDGYLLSSLTIIDLEDEQVITIAESERVQLVDWYDDYVVFVQIAAGASGTNPGRHRLMSYDYSEGRERELARSNYFNSIASVNGYVYYAPSSIFQIEPSSLFKIRADGTDKATALDRESWGMHRVDQETIVVTTSNNWFEYDIDTGDTERLEGEPANLQNKLFWTNPWAEEENAWIEQRDGEGVLMYGDEEEVLLQQGGLSYPLRWLNETTLVYRVETIEEIADYAVSTSGGEPIKVRNVAPTTSIERWQHY